MTKTTFKEAALRAIAILGLLAILLLGAWGIIQLAFFISSLFNNAGGAVSNSVSTPAEQVVHETITTNIPASATAGTPVTVGWTHSGGSGNYAYAVVYSCADGLTFKAPVPTGATQSVSCDTPFNYTQAQSSLSITPAYSGSGDAKTTITILATNLATGAITSQASGSMTVHAAAKAPTKTTPPTVKSGGTSPKTTYVAGNSNHSNLYGYSDLSVAITSSYSQNGRAVLQFVIQNIGTNVTPSAWSFSAYLPISGGYTYQSPLQQALYPGDKIVYSMGYGDDSYGYYPQQNNYSYNNQYNYNPYGCAGNGAYGYGCANTASAYYGGYQQKTVTITVDPQNLIVESYKGNNSATASYVAY